MGLKVLVITTSFLPKVNGVTRTVKDLSTGLCLAGDQVTVLTRWRIGLPRGETGKCPQVVRTGIGRRFGEGFCLVLFLSAAALDLARKEKVNLIHAHGTLPGLAAIAAGLLTGKRFVVTFHQDALLGWETGYHVHIGLRAHLTRLAQKLVCSRASAVTVQSDGVGDIVRRALRFSKPEKIVILPNPIDTSRLHPQATTQVPTGRTILFVGNLLKRKGIDILLQAFAVVLRSYPEARLRVIGTGPQSENLLELAKKLRVFDNISFEGQVGDAELINAYRGSSVFVLPSRAELFGIVLAEAMLLETPVVTTRTVGAVSIVRSGSTGILVDIGDPVELAAGIISTLSEPERAREMARRGRDFVMSNFSLEVVIPTLRIIYERALQQ